MFTRRFLYTFMLLAALAGLALCLIAFGLQPGPPPSTVFSTSSFRHTDLLGVWYSWPDYHNHTGCWWQDCVRVLALPLGAYSPSVFFVSGWEQVTVSFWVGYRQVWPGLALTGKPGQWLAHWVGLDWRGFRITTPVNSSPDH